MIKGNHNNCAQFANSMRLNWLFSRLGSQAGGEGMLDVLHCVLIDSPEALNVMKVRNGGRGMMVAEVRSEEFLVDILGNFKFGEFWVELLGRSGRPSFPR